MSRNTDGFGSERNIQKHWNYVTKQSHGNALTKGPSNYKTEELLQLSKSSIRTVAGLLTRYCTLNGYLQKIGIIAGDTN